MRKFHKSRRPLSLLLLLIFSFQFLQIPLSFALTGGPSQPETQGFQQAGTSDMVNLFTGDFSYNIPLFELPGPNGGYPFNLSYQSGIGMDQEASWVGLGWSLSPGAINRQMRGLPDEFKEDEIETYMDMKSSVTVGLGAGAGVELFGNDNLATGIGLGVNYNNYSGFGYSIDANVGYSGAVSESAGGVGLGVSLNSKEGVSVTPSLSLAAFSTNATYNSRNGLSSVNYDISSTKSFLYKNKDGEDDTYTFSGSIGSGRISLSSPGYVPQISMPMWNANLAGQFKLGGAFWGVFGNGYIKGFYNQQWLKNKKEWVRTKAYGYLNYQKSDDKNDLLDFNREKDGLVTNNSSNLASPSLTYDIYSASGQGISAMYRPMRNDFGLIHGSYKKSETAGISGGVDVGPAATHVGVNAQLNYATSVSGTWEQENEANEKFGFQRSSVNDDYRPWYFKTHGEPTAESDALINSIGGEEAVRVKLQGSDDNVKATSQIENNEGWSTTITDISSNYRERRQQSQNFIPITKSELVKGSSELLNHFKNKYYDSNGNIVNYDRSGAKDNHPAGFTTLNGDGLRYNYTIPAYNKVQEELLFTVEKPANGEKFANVKDPDSGSSEELPSYKYKGKDNFIKRTKTPEYAHSYLLTSILGPDYVDVTGDGVTKDDLGYWVKFTYQKTQNSYKWRDPFSGAHYQKGWETDPRDDKGSFTHGEKELWFLKRAETKSHIAIFDFSKRNDGKGAFTAMQDDDDTGASTNKLDAIYLYTRTNLSGNPIKTTRFEYNYSRCQGVYNNSNDGGKLTLEKLWFEYGGVSRPTGYISPYEFTYHESNPSYDRNAYDRWGNYKPHEVGDPLSNSDFPYTEQDPIMKEQIDDWAASWSLSQIQLPSGGKIKIDYETDDYAYVQHLEAMQMMDVVSSAGSGASIDESQNILLSGTDTKVRFKLEQVIPVGDNIDEREEVLKYLDERTKQLFFKFKTNLRSESEDKFEFIQGYADIDFSAAMGLEPASEANEFEYGYFYVKKIDGYNPFTLRAWQHLRTNQPELANSEKQLEPTEDEGEMISHIKSLGNVFTQIKQMFEGFNDFCNSRNWGKEVEAGKAWVRLKSPDGIKYGGGLRVKQITMTDGGEFDEEGVYGQIYEYTTLENDMEVSSGVAAYEPLFGGEENPHRYAKKWVESVPLRSDNQMFFEYPVNESYFPGPQVGYSKVTVTSLASAFRAGKEVLNTGLSDGSKLFPQDESSSFGTTGATVHEYYTSKDFPVITDETEKVNKPHNLNFPIPLLGNLSIEHLTTSQGYSIVTNDMHGKPKKISNFKQSKEGEIDTYGLPISYVKYNYATEAKAYQGKQVDEVNAKFTMTEQGNLKLATSADLADSNITKYTLSQENEFFADMREHLDKSWMGGGSNNVDVAWIFAILPVPIPIPSFWPSVSKSEKLVRTAVTNKIIYKSGILTSVEAYDGGSDIVTENLEWDRLTGQPVLTKVNNNFDDPVYTYKNLAYNEYEGMGAAYENIGLKYSVINLQSYDESKNLYRFTPNSNVKDLLYPGDEVILYSDEAGEEPALKAIFDGKREDEFIFYCAETPTQADYTAKIIRSGRRNQLGVESSSVTALSNPLEKGNSVNYSKTYQLNK